jgi:hypothetical protein
LRITTDAPSPRAKARSAKEKSRLAAGLSCSRLVPATELAILTGILALAVWILLLLAGLLAATLLLLTGLLGRILVRLAGLVLIGHLKISLVERSRVQPRGVPLVAGQTGSTLIIAWRFVVAAVA